MKELIATQLEDGYLGTYTPQERFIDYGEKGYEPAENLPLWDVWAHKYNLLGLLNYYRRTGFEPALQASRRIGDLLCKTYGDGAGQKSIVRNDWHVGMANTSVLEPMAMLYRYTGDAKYLEFCRYIVRAWDEPKGPKIATTLVPSGHVNEVANAKAYEMTSNLVGLLELHLATGDEAYLRPVLRAWEDIVKNRLYPSGTTSWGELFRSRSPPPRRRQGGRRMRHDDLDAVESPAAGADRRGQIRRRDRADDLQRAARRTASKDRARLLLHAAERRETVRCRRSGSARRELLHVEHSARTQPDSFSRVGRPQQRDRGEPVRAGYGEAGYSDWRRDAGSTTRFPMDGDVTLARGWRKRHDSRWRSGSRLVRSLTVTAGGKTWSLARTDTWTIDRTWRTNDQVTSGWISRRGDHGRTTYPDPLRSSAVRSFSWPMKG